MPTDALTPQITDGSGYRVRRRDLEFLGISQWQLDCWRRRSAPLGMSEIQYRGFLDELSHALDVDGISVARTDIRLKGSSAEFFSGHHKRMPRDRDEIFDLYVSCRKSFPTEWELREIECRLKEQWILDDDFPSRRPFDSMHRLNIAPEPSDYDLQISSDEVVERCEGLFRELGLTATTSRTIHPDYNFVRKHLLEKVMPQVYLFSLRMAASLGRDVTIAVFPSEGPPDTSNEHGSLSAHFRSEDWLLPC